MSIRIRWSFVVYMLMIALMESPEACIGIASALAIHEGAHIAAAILSGEKLSRLDITPFGGVMSFRRSKSALHGIKGFIIAACGPVANYLSLVIMSRFAMHTGSIIFRSAMTAHAGMMVVNLLPVLPLDGGRALMALGYYWFSVSAMTQVLCGLGMLAAGALLFLVVYGAVIWGEINLSLLIVSVCLYVGAANEGKTYLSDNLFALVCERIDRNEHRPNDCEAVQLIRVRPETV